MERFIVFTRYPHPGRVKSRLIPAVGADAAAAVHKRLTEHILREARELGGRRGTSIEVRFEGASREEMRRWLGTGPIYTEQGPGDLGSRMADSIRHALEGGAKQVVLAGSDCPGLKWTVLEDAFSALQRHELVLGPAHDGGYYLIGMRRFLIELFEDIAWGTAGVFRATVEKAARQGIRPVLLETLADIDRPEDLEHWQFGQ